MDKDRVFVPLYNRCEYANLAKAVEELSENNRRDLQIFIDDIVEYNIRYRDCLRTNGIEGVIKLLISEAPKIAENAQVIEVLRERWRDETHEQIADYNIQCLPKKSRFCVEGCWFDGLEDVVEQVEMIGYIHHLSKWYAIDKYKHNAAGLHIAEIKDSYPKFDIYDIGDDRFYCNYLFSRQPFTEELMERYEKEVPRGCNCMMVHENIPHEFLPILYYNGDSDWMLLASSTDPIVESSSL